MRRDEDGALEPTEADADDAIARARTPNGAPPAPPRHPAPRSGGGDGGEPEGRGFNISRWALEHPALTRYLMVVLMVLGLAAYFQLGQDEDPPFTFRAMVVQAYWPGASASRSTSRAGRCAIPR